MKRTLSIIFAIVLIFVLAACNAVKGNGTVSTEVIEVSDFTHINFSGFGNLVVTVGETESLNIRTDENLQDLMQAEVRGDTLYIGQHNNTGILNSTELVFTVTVVDLESLNLSGAGSVNLVGLEGTTFSVNASGASDIEISELDVDSFSIEISGAGSATAEGRADDLAVTISGVGSFSGFDLASELANIEISGAGSAEVTVSDTLTGSISGAGNITYRGNPTVDVGRTGAGSVNSDN